MAARCPDYMPLHAPLSNFLFQKIFPLQFLVTVIGNTLTMSVLLNSNMRNRANHLLAALAFCDIFVFASMLMHSMAAFPGIIENFTIRWFFFASKKPLGAMANWFSAAAIWLVLAVSIERLLIIKFPFRSLRGYQGLQGLLSVVGIFLLTGGLTAYHLVSYDCFVKAYCNGTKVYGVCLPITANWSQYGMVNRHSDMLKTYVNVSTLANAFLVVIIPVSVVSLVNISLIRILKHRNSQEIIVQSVTSKKEQASSVADQERRMTITVCAIVSCFCVTQTPSALIFIYEMISSDQGAAFHNLSAITNTLVLTGKMLNVVLFCLTSAIFRRKLFSTLHRWVLCIVYCNKATAHRLVRNCELSKSVITQKSSIANDSPHPRIASLRRTSQCQQPLTSARPIITVAPLPQGNDMTSLLNNNNNAVSEEIEIVFPTSRKESDDTI